MAVSMWRMNGLWRRMAGILVLCFLLLSNEVLCQTPEMHATSPSTVFPPSSNNPGGEDAPAATAASKTAPTPGAAGGDDAPEASTLVLNDDKDGDISGNSDAAAALPGRASDVALVPEVLVLNVNCVGKEDIPENNAVSAVVTTTNCEETKQIIEENPAAWCLGDSCDLNIAQDGNKIFVASKDAKLSTLADVLQSSQLKDKLGVTKTETLSSPGSSVFAGILVSGLLVAIGIVVGYWKCQRRSVTKEPRLPEDAYPVDQENQGNTLVSVAPLNPPPETQEKPSVNGESPEAAKTQPPPPTNGHSTAKTADTEL
ncbi:uncharacterized protein si:dkey-261h17.1 [Toxotes jaculatrix]|uniref:uncharacterized protein si:dkey-261h17.1 n=1 Tax=Toxotes jaculatrix TaxID=941984 RepID=UPI001B3AB68E|nr:uncharacterized protein si:dkey-261h17.1 [Toxotes jaculatrix]